MIPVPPGQSRQPGPAFPPAPTRVRMGARAGRRPPPPDTPAPAAAPVRSCRASDGPPSSAPPPPTSPCACPACPEDGPPARRAALAPGRHAFATADGSTAGDAPGAGGMFVLGRPHAIAALADGSGQTVPASEQWIRIAGRYSLILPTG